MLIILWNQFIGGIVHPSLARPAASLSFHPRPIHSQRLGLESCIPAQLGFQPREPSTFRPTASQSPISLPPHSSPQYHLFHFPLTIRSSKSLHIEELNKRKTINNRSSYVSNIMITVVDGLNWLCFPPQKIYANLRGAEKPRSFWSFYSIFLVTRKPNVFENL